MKGTVSWWNEDRGYGCFVVEGMDGELFAHRNDFLDIPPESALIDTEPVEFELGSVHGRTQAVQVKRLLPELNQRLEGVVKNFDRKRGTGWIAREGDPDIFVHWSDIVDQRKIKFLAPEEEVEFSIGFDEAGRNRAIYVTHDTRPAMLQFADLNDFPTHLRKLATLAEDEPWTFKVAEPEDLAILNHYVLNTFRRARFETRRLERNKITIKEQGPNRGHACFNTGLVTEFEEPIYGYFTTNRSRDPKAPNWWLDDFCVRSDLKLSIFDRLPERVTVVERPAELIYDWRRDLRLRKDHVSHRLERLSPEVLEELNRRGVSVMEAVDRAKDDALNRLQRDYKVAVPQFYRGEVQLLLPLCIRSRHEADVALVVERHDEAYYGNTLLTLEQAYFNARLIAKPNGGWLRPPAPRPVTRSNAGIVEPAETPEGAWEDHSEPESDDGEPKRIVPLQDDPPGDKPPPPAAQENPGPMVEQAWVRAKKEDDQ